MIYAEVTELEDRYKVDIHPDELFFESVLFESIHLDLDEHGYTVKKEIQIDDGLWHFVLDESENREKAYRGYGLIIDYHKVGDVLSVLESGRSKDGKHFFPAPGTELAKESKQYNNCIVYQDKDLHIVWSGDKQTLDILRKKSIEWKRNHSYRIERYL